MAYKVQARNRGARSEAERGRSMPEKKTKKTKKIELMKIPADALAALRKIAREFELLGAQRMGLTQGLQSAFNLKPGSIIDLDKGVFEPPEEKPEPEKEPEEKPKE